MKKLLLVSAAAMLSMGAFAQDYLTLAPEGGFNIKGGKDYVVLYAPDQVITEMGSRIAANENLDPQSKENYLMYWTRDWAPSELTIYNVPIEPPVKNSFGEEGEYINATPIDPWGTGVFTPLTRPYDLSKVTNEHHIHIGLRDFGSAPSKYKFQVGPQNKIKTNGFQFEVGLGVGMSDGEFVGIGQAPEGSGNGADAKWFYIDLPISELVDPDGEFGFEYNFSQKFSNTGVFAFTFKDPVCSTAKYGSIPPGETIKTVEITKLGSALSLDHVFFYVPDESGVNNIMDAAPETVEAIYTIDGRKVNAMDKGIYIVKTNKGTNKVIR